AAAPSHPDSGTTTNQRAFIALPSALPAGPSPGFTLPRGLSFANEIVAEGPDAPGKARRLLAGEGQRVVAGGLDRPAHGLLRPRAALRQGHLGGEQRAG